MKKQSISCISLTIAFAFFGCHGNHKREDNNGAAPDAQAFVSESGKSVPMDTQHSTVIWKGSNLAGSNSHEGYVHLSKGQLRIDNGRVTSGNAEIDMNTIEDEKHDRGSGLVKHLKNPDFFDVGKYPVASVELIDMAPVKGLNKKIYGNLTIKGIANQIIFPAKVEVKDGIARINGRFAIDRTKWDIRYKSGKFYDLIADESISDSIEFRIDIVTLK